MLVGGGGWKKGVIVGFVLKGQTVYSVCISLRVRFLFEGSTLMSI